jgi:UPF0271 protein
MNLDAGELPDESEALWSLFDLLNVACGGHAGDRASMARVTAFASAHRVTAIGAHPSYPDREGFGRKTMSIAPDTLADAISEQCTVLARIAAAHGIAVVAMKPHGALYHDAAADPALAAALVHGATRALGKITVVGPPRGGLLDAAVAAGLRYAREGFADRNTRADGSLVPRTEPNALITDPLAAAARAVAIAGDVDTICVHADTPGSLAIAQAVRKALHG